LEQTCLVFFIFVHILIQKKHLLNNENMRNRNMNNEEGEK